MYRLPNADAMSSLSPQVFRQNPKLSMLSARPRANTDGLTTNIILTRSQPSSKSSSPKMKKSSPSKSSSPTFKKKKTPTMKGKNVQKSKSSEFYGTWNSRTSPCKSCKKLPCEHSNSALSYSSSSWSWNIYDTAKAVCGKPCWA